jgi:hypothetical protein
MTRAGPQRWPSARVGTKARETSEEAIVEDLKDQVLAITV